MIDLTDLFEAYLSCRKNKRNTMNALAFEIDYEHQLITLHQEINEGRYRPGRSIAFIVDQPVQREIFAADFRDRVVHHLVMNKLNPLFEKTFIYDSYACRKNKGTHVGIQRVDRFIRQCSKNYTTDCYTLKLDIKGFFMAIDKGILLKKLLPFIDEHYHESDKAQIRSLCQLMVENDPTSGCLIKGSRQDWSGLPPDKSLFHSAPNCGLPIGNLTSQILANFYMNTFDHFIKHDLGVRYYGRYVDDMVLVHSNEKELKAWIPMIANFLTSELKLSIHPKKTVLQHSTKGVLFLGAMIKPHRILMGKRIKGNFYEAINKQNRLAMDHPPNRDEQALFLCSMNSYLGLMKHYNTYRLRYRMLRKNLSSIWWGLMYLSGGSKFVSRK